MPDGLNPIVKRYLKGTVESRGKELTWETDDHGFLFVIDGKYYEVPYKEFIYEGPDQFIQLTHDAVIDRSIVGIYRTIAVYCTELLLHPETFSYYDRRLVTAHLGKLLSGEITTDKGKFKWRITSESVEVDCKPRASMMYVSHKYYTSEIWALLAPDVPYNVCQMFVIIGNLYIRCTKFNEPEVVLSLKDIQYNIQMRKEAERRQREMEEQRKAEEKRRKEASAKKYGGGVDIGLGGGVDIGLDSGGTLYHDEFSNTSETAKAVASSGGVSLPKFGEEEPQFEQIPIDDAISSPEVKQEVQAKQEIEIQPQVQQGVGIQIQPEAQIQVQEEQVQPEIELQVQEEQVQPEVEVQVQEEQMQPEVELQVQEEQVQPEIELQQEVQVQEETEIQSEVEIQAQEEQVQLEEQEQSVQPEGTEVEEEQQQEADTSYMDAIMQYLEEMDLPTKNPERSIKKYYPEWALEPIKDLTGDAFLKEFAKML